jgi:hypothetical protein
LDKEKSSLASKVKSLESSAAASAQRKSPDKTKFAEELKKSQAEFQKEKNELSSKLQNLEKERSGLTSKVAALETTIK